MCTYKSIIFKEYCLLIAVCVRDVVDIYDANDPTLVFTGFGKLEDDKIVLVSQILICRFFFKRVNIFFDLLLVKW